MIRAIENTIGRLFYLTGADNLYRIAERNRCVILNYHRILNQQEFNNGINGVLFTEFRRQMEFVAANYRCLSLSEIGARLANREPFPIHSVAITFDDGYLDNYHAAFPVLKSLGLKATFFVCPGMIDGKCSYWWDQLDALIDKTIMNLVEVDGKIFRLNSPSEKRIAKSLLNQYILGREHEREEIISTLRRNLGVKVDLSGYSQLMQWRHLKEMRMSGMEIGAHTMTHISLGPTAFFNGSGEKEILQSKQRIERELDAPVKLFAFPYGNEQHVEPRAISLLRKAEFDVAVSGVVGVTRLNSDIYFLPRIAIQSHDCFPLFKSKISGIYLDAYRSLRKFIRMTNGSTNHRNCRAIS